MKLKNKVAIVTGASNGIGRAIAVGFAKEGAKVAVGYFGHPDKAQEVVDEIRSLGSDGIIFRSDISKIEDSERMVETTAEAFGRVDILVNNAGARDQAPIMEVTPELWQHAIDSNLRSLFWSVKTVTPYMIRQGGGKIINIASLMGVRQCNPSRTAYCTTKRGILSLTQSEAVELGPYHICVNAISPGTIETNMGGLKAQFTPEVIAERCKYIPLRYRAKPEAIVGPAVFLASGDSDYVTGQNIVVDGGWCAAD